MATNNLAAVSQVSALTAQQNILCEADGSVRRITVENLRKQMATDIVYPSYTLEQSSNPAFSVHDSAALSSYMAEVGGYMLRISSGKVYAAKLNPENWNYFEDGTAVDDASKYECMVHLPTFHFKASGKTMTIGGLSPIDGGHTFEAPHWVGAYEGYIADSALHSRPDVSPSHSQTMSSFWNYAQKLGTEWGLANYQFHCLINCLFQAKYGNLNSQAVIGTGGQTSDWESWRDVKMGYGRGLGDGSGSAATSMDGQNCVKLFGFEDLWGKLWEFRPGIRFYYSDSTRHAIVYDGNVVSNTATGRDFTVPLMNAGGKYVTKMQLGEYWDMVPIAVGGGSTTYYCDGYLDTSSGELLYVGGYAGDGAQCGLSYAAAYAMFYASRTISGARLAFYGEPDAIVSGSKLITL